MPLKLKNIKTSTQTKKEKRAKRKESTKPNKDAEPEELSFCERELLNIKIKNLEEQLLARDKYIEKLRHSKDQFKIFYEKESKDKEDTVSFLKGALEDRAVEVTELQERLIGLQVKQNMKAESADFRYATLEKEFKLKTETLTEEIMLLSGKLSALEEFREQKEDILKKLSKAEAKIVHQNKAFKEEIRLIEERVLKEKENLMQDVVFQVERVAYEFRSASEEQMSFTIKKTIEENIELNKQLSNASKKALLVVRKNDCMEKKLKILKDHLSVTKETESHLALKVEVMKKAINGLTAKERIISDRLTSFQNDKDKYEMREKEILKTREELDDKTCKVKILVEENKTLKDSLSSEMRNIEIVSNKARQLYQIMKSCALVIQQEMKVNAKSINENNSMLHVLLELLLSTDKFKDCV